MRIAQTLIKPANPARACHSIPSRASQTVVTALAVLAVTAAQAGPAASCSAQSTLRSTPVIELYTSEGCSSCPPADRWITRAASTPDVVALAFHVDYWNDLGWVDRFASAAFTQRQAQQRAVNGARFSYTPQVVINGIDRPDWPQATLPARTETAVQITLARSGSQYAATVQANAPSPARLAAYWAVTENRHLSVIRAGENHGITLTHDHVVREFHPVAAWPVRSGQSVSLQFLPAGSFDAEHPREINLVLLDADTGRPVQALKLGC